MDLFTRPFFTAEHREFREQVRRFVAQRIAPFHAQWEEAGCVPREIFREAGALGMLCCTVDPEWGGPGADYLFTVVALEEMADAHAPGPGFGIHSEMATPYVSNFGSAQQKAQWLPRLVSGDAIAGVALTEPDAGSDLKRLRTRAIRTPDGWRLSGQKVFISNGQLADLFVVAARTE
jgi:acyl-CoA dehydrogenase